MPKEKPNSSQAKTNRQPSNPTNADANRTNTDEAQNGSRAQRSADQSRSSKSRDKKKSDSTEKPVMTRQEAGRLGGKATARNHGSDYYKNLGRRGAEARWGGTEEEEESERKKESA